MAWEFHQIDHAISRRAVCNDGTPATYWVDRGSKDVMFYFRGGENCTTEAECAARDPRYTHYWGPSNAPGHGGILDDRAANPVGDWTKVYLAYCSSDNYLGDATLWGWEFRGRRIAEAVFAEVRMAGLITEGSRILLVGSSAGAAGASQIADWVQERIPYAAVSLVVEGAVRPSGFSVPNSALPWNPTFDADCADDPVCIDGDAVRRYVSVPTFAYTDIYDRHFLGRLGVGWYSAAARDMAELIAAEARNFPSVYTTSIHTHTLATKPGFYREHSRCESGETYTYAAALEQWLDTGLGPACVVKPREFVWLGDGLTL